ncbi:unnamed protein product [Eruca vesicaria subsp. sativa]|uniref:At1g68980-like TPR repeats domain-containing protein n=1 Tax=Eruca vesicaria subsp. sativa TaxID=29727 RepID=A0ABC8JGK0_ERUVS|nr:unnamed protein product [Eruca vesicaria subsp. sativa]
MLRKTLTLLPRRRPFSSSSFAISPLPSKTLTHLQVSSFESSLHSSLTTHNTDQAWKLFRSFAASSSLPNKPLLNSLITQLSSETTTPHKLKRAFVSAAYVIEKDPTFLEPNTLLTLFRSMKLAKAPSPALALVKCMFKNRVFVPFDLWGGLVIDTCRESGNLASFLIVFKESCGLAVDERLDYMKPGLDACNAALEACCREIESLTDAESVIELMDLMGVKPDECSFGFLGYLYARRGVKEKVKEVESLVDGSKRVLYSSLISGYVKSGDLDSVYDVVLRGGCGFSEETYCEIVKGFIESKKVKSLATLIIEAQRLESESVEIERSVGFGVINACVNLGFSGKSILDEMNAQGGSGGIGVYVPILKAYCKENRTSEATQLVKEISSSGVQLDAETYKALIEASMTKQDFVSALTLFRDMRETRVVTDLKGSYLTIMTGLLENQRPELMASFVEEVLEDVEVKSHDWNSIIHAFCKSRRLEDAKRTFRRMVFLQYEPNHQTYLSLINGYVSCGRYFEVVVLWKEFKEGKKAKLDHALADAFLNALVRGGFFGTAMQVVEKCKEMKIFVDKWRYKAVFMETLKNLRLPKLRKRKVKKIEFLDAFKNWVGITT